MPPLNDNALPQIHFRLTEAEARQMDDARARLRLSRNDLVRLALDDLYRGPRLEPREQAITTRKTVPAVAA